MTFFSGSGTASTIKTQLQTTIPANPAWSLVESTTFGASAYAADVYKCDHTVSGLSADFYVMILINSTVLYYGLAEGYNSTTHKPKRPTMKATSALVTLQADGGIIPASTELDWYEGTSGGLTVVSPNAAVYSGTGTFYLVVAKDAIIVADRFTSGSNANKLSAYVGAYETQLGSDDPLPLIVQAGWGYSTRHPRRGGLSTGYACNLNGVLTDDTQQMLNAPTTGADFVPLAEPGSTDPNAYDAYRGSDPGAGKVAVLNSWGSTAGIGRASNGWRRGWMKYLRYTPTTGLLVGDTMLIDGVQYFYSGANGIWIEMDPA